MSLISFQSHLFIYSWMLITGLHLVPVCFLDFRNIGVHKGNKSRTLSCYPQQLFRRFLALVSIVVNKLNRSQRMHRSYITTILSCGFLPRGPTARGGGQTRGFLCEQPTETDFRRLSHRSLLSQDVLEVEWLSKRSGQYGLCEDSLSE